MFKLSFAKWLTEARQRFAPGSQSDPRYRQSTRPDMKSSGLGVMGMDYNTRVSRGRSDEEKIKEALAKQHNIHIAPASQSADMYDKIDGFWNGQEAIQIKYRDADSANGRFDILYELIKPYDRNLPLSHQQPGRDVKSKAQAYVVLDPTGRMIYKIPTKMIKLLLQQAIREFGDGPLLNSFKASNGVELKPTNDPRDGTSKIISFISPQVFQGISERFPVNMQI